MVVLTRNAAKKIEISAHNQALNRDDAIVTVSPSATGKGRHTRWQYQPSTPEPTIAEEESFNSLSSGSMSSLSSLSDSSFDSSSDEELQNLATPLQHVDRMLRRSMGERWTTSGGTGRLVLVPDSFTVEAINMRESIKEKQLDEVFNKQWDIMMKKRQADLETFGLGLSEGDDDSTDMDMDMDTGRFARVDTQFVEGSTMYRRFSGPSSDAREPPRRRGKPLGPHGTELIDLDTHTYTPRAQYVSLVDRNPGAAESSTSRGLKWQPTEMFIS